jgi:hypothetical protein
MPATATSLVLRMVQVSEWAPPSCAARLSEHLAEHTDDSPSSAFLPALGVWGEA